ncbi:glycosyltransferase family 2 protein [Anaeroselena agilis]|uniref:Glycosyltransferase family 2 protein n=1 Tax=Anaeroselena agilis TaxID=3063788 RepID=A0ABU3P4K3_9FIRM|nr:glycosyltransferase family 2 protein [Selenomonadales bacterium 4137-cl]
MVSIIMPAYNVQEYIAASIESVIAQTYVDWELIVVNDGSTDGTEDVVLSYARKEPRIVYYRQSNQGAAAGRNKGLAMAGGRLVAFLDGDDLWHPLFLAKVAAAWQAAGAGVAFSDHERLFADGRREINRNKLYAEKGLIAGDIYMDTVTWQVWMHLGAMLMPKELLTGNGIDFTAGCLMWEDVEFQLKVLAVARVTHVPEVLMAYRERPGSTTRKLWRWETYVHQVYAVERVLAFIGDVFPADRRKAFAATRRLVDFECYRFLYKMLKIGRYADMLGLMDAHGWDSRVRRVIAGDLGFRHRIRAWLVVCGLPQVWRAIALVWRLLLVFRPKDQLRAG